MIFGHILGRETGLLELRRRRKQNKQEAVLYRTVDSGSMVGLLEKNVRNLTMSILWNIDA